MLGLLTLTWAGCLVDRMVSDRSVRAQERGGYYVAPTGSSGGDGSSLSPWDLATALAGANGQVQPGDTIWLRGGTYRRAGGGFLSEMSGAPGNPVVVRAYPGERAIIDGAGTPSGSSSLTVSGSWVVLWGFEVTNSDPSRMTTSTASNVRANGISNYGHHTRYINLVIHDAGVAFYTDPGSVDAEIAGCIIYNNGWQGPGGDRGHGHGLYLQSDVGPIVARDNVVFNQFGYGAHVYVDAGMGHLRGIRLEGNVLFNNGSLSDNSISGNIVLGGEELATDDALLANMTYVSASVQGATNVQIGYGLLRNGEVALRDNYFVGGALVLDVGAWDSTVVTANTFVGSGTLIALRDTLTGAYRWRDNVFSQDSAASVWSYAGAMYGLADWVAATHLDAAGQAEGAPTATRVIVRPNPYEAGRAHVVVYNWGKGGAAFADLRGILAPGDRYEVRNVQALNGAPVASGTYNGIGISLSMEGVTPPVPVGFAASRAPRTGPEFDVFVVERLWQKR
jgi:hypothetical protein